MDFRTHFDLEHLEFLIDQIGFYIDFRTQFWPRTPRILDRRDRFLDRFPDQLWHRTPRILNRPDRFLAKAAKDVGGLIQIWAWMMVRWMQRASMILPCSASSSSAASRADSGSSSCWRPRAAISSANHMVSLKGPWHDFAIRFRAFSFLLRVVPRTNIS